MIQITRKPQINIGHFFGLKRPSIELEISIQKHLKLPVHFWVHFEIITEISLSDDIKSKNYLSIEDFVDMICKICFKTRVPSSSNNFIKEISPLKYLVAIPYFYPIETLGIAQITTSVINTLMINTNKSDDQVFLRKLQDWYNKKIGGVRRTLDKSVNNYFILSASDRLGISTRQSLMRTWIIGNGINCRTFNSTLTDQTPSLAVSLASDKHLTAQLLNKLGFPGANHRLVRQKSELDTAVKEIGFPLVIKPADQEQGIGVNADLRTTSDVEIAFSEAQKYSKNILVEKHQQGFTHRLTVINHEVIKIVKRIAGGVTGDGKNSIEQLIFLQQQSPIYKRRMDRKARHLLELDKEALSLLKQYQIDPSHIPKEGQYIRLRRRDNINAGGNNVIIDINNVHPDNINLVKSISVQFNFDIVGIDLIIEDIKKSWLEIGATVCEINAKPQLAANEDDRLYEKIITSLLPNKGRIPIDIGIYNSIDINNNQISPIKLVNHLNVDSIFLSCEEGLYQGRTKLTNKFSNSFVAAKAALDRKEASSLFALLSYEDIKKYGLPISVNQLDKVHILSKDIDKATLKDLFNISEHFYC